MTSTRLTIEEENSLILYAIQMKGRVDAEDFEILRARSLVTSTGAILKADREQQRRKERR